MELLTVTALIGVFASVAAPIYKNYAIQARSVEGVMLLDELRRRVEVEFNRRGVLTEEIPSSPSPSGQKFGGPYYTYEALFGASHEIWESVEYQPKGPHRVIVLRAHRKPEWDNSDIGLHLQVRLASEVELDFRCTINNLTTRAEFVPGTCRDGDVNDWVSW